MAVSAAIAAALAAKYPNLAAEAAGAEPLRLVEQTQTVRGVTKVIARFRKYRVGNQVVGLDEPEVMAEDKPLAGVQKAAPVVHVPRHTGPDVDETPIPVAAEPVTHVTNEPTNAKSAAPDSKHRR